MKQMSKQTAVQWFINKDTQATIDFIEGKITSLELAVKKATFIEQAKEIEKEQHLESYRVGNTFTNSASLDFKDFFDEYYIQTYGGDK